MTLTTIDPKPALVVIDVQKGLLAYPTVRPVGEIARQAGSLAAAFRDQGLPVVLVNVTGGAPGRTEAGGSRMSQTPPADFAELVDELGARPDDILVTKQRWGAFHGTRLHDRLRELGVTQIVLAGVSTSIGVESTARAAYEHGYHVVLATDAMTDTDADAERNSVERVFPRLGETATTAEILDELTKSR